MAINLNQAVISPKDIATEVYANIISNTVPFFEGSPGIGKSAIIASVAEKAELELIDIRLSGYLPEDINGLPVKVGEGNDVIAKFIPFDTFPLETTPVPEGKKGWLLFLDEFTSISKSVQAPIYKLILDRMVGNHKLNKKVRIVCAGNRTTDNAIAMQLSTALINRMVSYVVETQGEDFVNAWLNWAAKNKIDSRIIGYLSWKKSDLFTFSNSINEANKPFATPRSWAMVDKHLKALEKLGKMENRKIPLEEAMPRIYGTIGDVASSFKLFNEVYEKLPTMEDILKDPTNVNIPTKIEHRYALTTYVASEMGRYIHDSKNVEAIIKFTERFKDTPEFLIYLLSLAMRLHPEVGNNAALLSILHPYLDMMIL